MAIFQVVIQTGCWDTSFGRLRTYGSFLGLTLTSWNVRQEECNFTFVSTVSARIGSLHRNR
eukprot:2058814-Amphidinium_carterae.1